MAEVTHNNKCNPSQSVETDQLPLFELVAKYLLPFITKAATTSVCESGSGRIVAGQLYRLHRLLCVKMIKAQVWNGRPSAETESSVLELNLPTKYQGRFQILPANINVNAAMAVPDILRFMPKLIKVLEFTPTKETGRVNLSVGDVLEVIGTTDRVMLKLGIQPFLRVKKNRCEFVLPPNFSGRFQLYEHKTFTIAEILVKFPLPQRVLMIPSNEHSQILLDMVSSADDGHPITFLLKQENEAEYVIGVDNQGLNAVVMDTDANVRFFPPIYTNNRDFMRTMSEKGGLSIDDLKLDQVICKLGNKLIMCKPWAHVFKVPPPVLAVKRPSTIRRKTEAATVNTLTDLDHEYDSDDEGSVGSHDNSSDSDGYERIPFSPGVTIEEFDEGNASDAESVASSYASSGSHGYERPIMGKTADVEAEADSDTEHTSEETDSESSGSGGYEHIPLGNTKNTTSSEAPPPLPRPNANTVVRQLDPKYGETHSAASTIALSGPLDSPMEVPCPDVTNLHKPDARTDSLPSRPPPETPIRSGSSRPKPPPKPTFSHLRKIPPMHSLWNDTSLTDTNKKQTSPTKPMISLPNNITVPNQNYTDVKPTEGTNLLDMAHRTGDEKKEYLKRRQPGFAFNPNYINTAQPGLGMSETTAPPLPRAVCRETEKQSATSHPSMPECKSELAKCTVEEVVDLLAQINIEQEVQEKFRQHLVDGALLCELDDVQVLQEQFDLSRFHAVKIVKFVNGWRPNTERKWLALI